MTSDVPCCDRCGSTVVWDDQGPQLCDPCALAPLGLAVADTEPATRPAVCTQCGGSGQIEVMRAGGRRTASVRCVCPAGLH